MSDGMRRELVYLSSHATNRYFIPNWGRICEICGSFFNCKLRAVSQGPEHEKINLFLLICSPTDFSFLLRYSPTDFTDLHRTFLLGKIL